jgi:undecaprenyl-diphosphatase
VIAQAPAAPIGILDAIVLGLVEGVTEFLPISSTGHLIVAQRLLGLPEGELSNLFAIGIQMGAITAILLLYWRRLRDAARTVLRPAAGGPNLLWQIAIAALPATALGLALDDWIDGHLFTPAVVAATTILGGILLLVLERWLAARRRVELEVAAMPYRVALAIGLFQCLALIPGTSRSAATIAGALVLGFSRAAAAEFSFLVGLPILLGAGVYKLARSGGALQGELLLPFAVATAAAFVSALAVVVPFVRFLRTHTFVPFAWYRIAAGALLAAACATGWLRA